MELLSYFMWMKISRINIRCVELERLSFVYQHESPLGWQALSRYSSRQNSGVYEEKSNFLDGPTTEWGTGKKVKHSNEDWANGILSNL